MIEVDIKREATASIRGYLYQLDATIKEIMTSNLHDQIIIEGIEDFDKYTDQQILYSQVKYYSGKNLTNSLAREPLFKLFTHYLGLDAENRQNRKYILYGHYSSINIPLKNISTDLFKDIMKYTKTIKDDKDNESVKEFSNLDGLECDDSLIASFCNCFEIIPSKNYEDHRKEVIDEISKAYSLEHVESQSFYYPNIFSYIANQASKSDYRERIITREKINKIINNHEAIHHHWLLREKDEREYGAFFRSIYFEEQNIAGVERFFIIEVSNDDTDSEVYNQILNISNKWSSVWLKRMGNAERFAPFIMLRGLSESRLIDIKHNLFDSGCKFVDGFPYKGSLFRSDFLMQIPTAEIIIPFRSIDCEENLLSVLQSIKNKRCVIYEFYKTSLLTLNISMPRIQKISIPIKKISTIEHIV